VGDYSLHGAEFLLFIQPTPSTLEAIKITGDRNVPRGHCSFKVELTNVVRVCHEEEFRGQRAVSGMGRIAGWYFSNPEWTSLEGIFLMDSAHIAFLTSHDEISVYWPALYNVSQFKRVDLTGPLDPNFYDNSTATLPLGE
jgi:Cyclin D1 binding domain